MQSKPEFEWSKTNHSNFFTIHYNDFKKFKIVITIVFLIPLFEKNKKQYQREHKIPTFNTCIKITALNQSKNTAHRAQLSKLNSIIPHRPPTIVIISHTDVHRASSCVPSVRRSAWDATYNTTRKRAVVLFSSDPTREWKWINYIYKNNENI